ncbi:MAG: SUMF1/EgtB/PvdO family nonheme iron enzyme [Candidatus Auribacterota bacterium]
MSRPLLKKVWLLFCVIMLSASSVSATVTFDWALIGNTGNTADTQVMSTDSTTGYGSVGYEYKIATTEVTTAQYVEFLNAVAGVDTYGLYNTNMANHTYYKGISISSGSGTQVDPYTYVANAGWGNRPVVSVSWYDTLRFANWMHNGQLSGAQDATTTEDGAYTFSGATSVSARNAGAAYWLPSEDEWYKAAYYDPTKGETGGYWDYATQTDSPDTPVAGVDANYQVGADYVDPTYYSTPVGIYSNDSYYGTYDQSGNAWEWNETLIGSNRGIRGGAWSYHAPYMLSSCRLNDNPSSEYNSLGFRIASTTIEGDGGTVPEPASVALILLSVSGLLLRRTIR